MAKKIEDGKVNYHFSYGQNVGILSENICRKFHMREWRLGYELYTLKDAVMIINITPEEGITIHLRHPEIADMTYVAEVQDFIESIKGVN